MSWIHYIRRAGRIVAGRQAQRTNLRARAGIMLAAGLMAVALGLVGLLLHGSRAEFSAPSAATALIARIKTTWQSPVAAAAPVRRADFREQEPTREVRHIADWVVDSRDNQALPFLVIDKTHAKIFVFNADGLILGAVPVLLGSAPGDESVPGIGERELSDIRPEERTTPAGRFVAERGRNSNGEDIIWVDYDAAVSLHRVRATNPRERRLERLATPTPDDNRISYGCINVPAKFYEAVIFPLFTRGNGIAYVLPETRAAQLVFGSYDVDARAQRPALKTVQEFGWGVHSVQGRSPVAAVANRLLRSPL